MTPFELVYSKENLEGMKRLYAYSQKYAGVPDELILLMIQTIVDEACADQITAEEIERRLKELNSTKFRKEDKYNAVMSCLEYATYYCAVDCDTEKLVCGPFPGDDKETLTFVSTNEDYEDRNFPDSDIYEVDFDTLLDMCRESGVTAFLLDPDINTMAFCLDQYMTNREALEKSKGMVNYALLMGIPGDMLFPAIVTYMHMKPVDCTMLDGTVISGIATSFLDNGTTAFAVTTPYGNVMTASRENVKWIKMYLA